MAWHAQGRSQSSNPFDDDDGGFGSRKGPSSSSQSSNWSSREPSGSGQSSNWSSQEPSDPNDGLDRYDYQTREQMAIRRMEESSANSLRTLNDTYRLGVDTTEELEIQAEKLDGVERRLDEMHVDLDKSKRNMRHIKSPFGGIANWFSKKKDVNEVTNPKGYKQPPPAKSSGRSGSKSGPAELHKMESTGSTVVDENLDEMSKQLDRMMGVGELIGSQLDDSSAQIDRITYKVERNEEKIKGVNKDIKRHL